MELIVVDGGSTDNSVEIIEKYANSISWWVSEKDEGQYHAVIKGFERSTGSIMAWLNSDDIYHPGCLHEIARIFNERYDVEWLMGYPTELTDEGYVINRVRPNYTRWSKHRYLTYDFQFIHQESVFWRRTLWEKSGGRVAVELKLAGDLELWNRFFRHARLHTTNLLIGAYRYRKGEQRSRENLNAYLGEARSVIRAELKRKGFVAALGYGLLRIGAWPFSVAYFFNFPVLKWVYPVLFGLPKLIIRRPQT